MRTLALLILIPILANAQGAGKQATRVKLIRSPKAVALAKAFHTGKLPDPLRMPAGNVDQQATALAKIVATATTPPQQRSTLPFSPQVTACVTSVDSRLRFWY